MRPSCASCSRWTACGCSTRFRSGRAHPMSCAPSPTSASRATPPASSPRCSRRRSCARGPRRSSGRSPRGCSSPRTVSSRRPASASPHSTPGRFQRAGIGWVADLGCGIGADAMAIASLGMDVTAVERDEVTAAIAAYNLAPWSNASVEHRRRRGPRPHRRRRCVPRSGASRGRQAAQASGRLVAVARLRVRAGRAASHRGEARAGRRPRPHPRRRRGAVGLGRPGCGRARCLVRPARPAGHPPLGARDRRWRCR